MERNAHILEHFAKKICYDCNKNLIQIGDEWYELHFHLVNDKMKCERSPESDTGLIEQQFEEDAIEANQYTTNYCVENESLHQPVEENFFPNSTTIENFDYIKNEGVFIVSDEVENERDEKNVIQGMEFYPHENKNECVADAGISVMS